jgi:hypothetical protein
MRTIVVFCHLPDQFLHLRQCWSAGHASYVRPQTLRAMLLAFDAHTGSLAAETRTFLPDRLRREVR